MNLPPLLRRTDQVTLAAAVLLAMGAMGIWWSSQGGWQGRLIEVETEPAKPAEFRVDINAATWPEFAQLPGIGPALAQRIVQSRTEKGPFERVEDLRRVRGIGPVTFARIRPYLEPLPATSSAPGRSPRAASGTL